MYYTTPERQLIPSKILKIMSEAQKQKILSSFQNRRAFFEFYMAD